jgi:heme-degrading monooxygenase HmoA
MIARIWRTQIGPSRAEDYRRFAHSKSLPMFREQPGFVGVLFAANLAERAVITLWRDHGAARRLDQSEAYRSTVAAIDATGFLRGESTVEIFELEGFFLDDSAARSGNPIIHRAPSLE